MRHRKSFRSGFEHDGREMLLTSWERWPKVGGSFFIWIDAPDAPHLLEYWRQSSEVVPITELPVADKPG